MRLSLALPIDEPQRIAEYARAIEASGFDACFVTDHPAPPDEWLTHGGHRTLDPFVALAAAAAATTTLRVHTHCLIPAYRHPLIVAKSVASLAVCAPQRVIVGVAVGYLEGEFDNVGVPFNERAQRLDDSMIAIRTHVDDAPPIWVGGNSTAAMRRALTYGSGWAPFPASARTASATATTDIPDIDALEKALMRFRELGGERHDVCFTPFSHPAHKDVVDPDAFIAEAHALARIGVTWLAFHVPPDAMADFAAAVIPHVRS